MKTIKEILSECKGEEDFKPHMMYDPKTGKGYKADTYADHVKMDKMGYTHEKPEIKEDVSTAIFGSMLLALAPFYVMAGKAMADDLKQLKTKSAKKGFKPSKEDQSLLQKFVAMVKRKKPDAVKNAMKKANESVELEEGVSKTYKGNTIHQVGKHRSSDDKVAYKLSNADAKILNKFMKSASAKERTQMHNMFWDTDEKDTDNVTAAKGPKMAIADLKKKTHGKSKKEELEEAKSSSGYELYHRDFSGAMQHAYAHAKKKGFIVDKDDVDHKVAMGPKRPSSGKTNKYILDTNKKQKLHVQVANLDNKRYELNMYIESVEEAVDTGQYGARKKPKSSKKQQQKAFDKTRKRGNDLRKMSDAEFKKWLNSDVEHDIEDGIKESFDLDTHMENARAKRDAMRAMGKRGKDSADIDMDATDDDRKAASKNVLMQIRKASDLPKGGDIEFEGGKKGKISQDDAKMIVKMFNTLNVKVTLSRRRNYW